MLPTMRMLENLHRTGSLMNNDWRHPIAPKSEPSLRSLKPNDYDMPKKSIFININLGKSDKYGR
jgi:hypothetical protein